MSDTVRELRDSLERSRQMVGDLSRLMEDITTASNNMGKAIEHINTSRPENDESKREAQELRKIVGEFEGVILKMANKLAGFEEAAGGVASSTEEQMKKIEELIDKTQEQIDAQEKTSSKEAAASTKEISWDRKMVKALRETVNALKASRKFSAEAASRPVGTGPMPVEGGGGGRTPPPPNRPSAGGGGGGSYEGAGNAAATGFMSGFFNNKRLKHEVASWMTEMSSLLMGGYGDLGQVLFAGSVRDVLTFRKEARELAFEIDGIGKSARGMQSEFADMGEVARQTGKSVDVMNEVFKKNVIKGFKGQGVELKKVLKSGLHLSTMIGSEAGSTAEMFADWNRMLGMSVDQMNQLAMDSKSIARTTGVTGDELISVMKSSEGILKNLRNQGNLTSAATKNILQAMAMAKKIGIEDKAAGVLDMMTSTNKFLEGDDKTRNFILKMVGDIPGGTDAAMQGNLMNNPEMLKGMMDNINTTISQFTNGAAKSVADMDKLSGQQKMELSAMLSRTFGMEMYEIKGIFDVVSDQTKSLADRFGDLDSEAKNVNESMEKRMLAEKKMTDLMVSSGMTFANKFTDAARKEKDKGKFGDAMGRVGANMTAAEKRDMLQMKEQAKKTTAEGGLGMTDADFAKTAGLGASKDYIDSLLISAAAMRKQGKEVGQDVKDFGPELLKAAKKAEAGGGSGDLVSLVDEMTKVGQEIGVKEKTGVDPTLELSQNINVLNQTLRRLISGPLGMLIDAMGWVGLALAQVVLIGGALFLKMGSLTKVLGLFSGFGRSIGLFGEGVEKSFSSVGKLGGSFDEFARSVATSSDVSEGFFKKFMHNYTNARSPGYQFTGMSGKMGEAARKTAAAGGGKGVLGSLNEAFAGLRDDMLNGLSRMRKGIGGFFRSFLSETGRFFGRFGKSFKRYWNAGIGKSGGLINVLGKSFTLAMRSGAGTKKVMNLIAGALGQVNAQYIKYLGTLRQSSPLLAKFLHNSVMLGKAFATLNFGQVIFRFGKALTAGFDIFKLAMTKGFSFVRNIFNPSAWMGLFKAGGKGLRAAILGGSMGTAQIIFSAIDMVFGAVSGFMNTGKNFEGVMTAMGKSTKDMTWGMYASSTVAGALVGILDGLTFGMLGLTGATKWLNETLSLVFYTIFSIVEGIVDGIMGAFKMVGSAFSYIGQQFKDIGDSVLGVFNSIAGLFGVQAGNWSEAFAVLYPYLKKIGTVIGFIVGTPLAAMLWLLVKGISAALVPVQMLINAFAGVIKIIVGFVNFFKEIFTIGPAQALKNLGGLIVESIVGVFKPIIDFFGSLAKDIMAPFKWLWETLVGHSIIPDLCVAIVGLFGKMAMNVIKLFGRMAMNIAKTIIGIPFKAVKFIASLPGMIFRGLQNAFFKAPKKVFEKIFKHINTKTLKTGMAAVGEKLSGFFGLFKDNLSKISGFFKNSWFEFLNTSTGGLFGKIVNSIKNSGMLKIVKDFLINPIAEGLSWVGSKASSVFKGVFDWVKGKVSNLLPKGAKEAASAAGSRAGSVLKGTFDWVKGKFSNLMPQAAKSANPFASMSGGMGKAAAKTAAAATEGAAKAASAATEGATKTNAFKGVFDWAKGKVSGLLPSAKGAAATTAAASPAVTGGVKAAAAAAGGADDLAAAAPKALGFIGKSSKLIGGLAKKLPIVGPALDLGIRTMGQGQSLGKAATGTAAGAAGGIGGAALGATIGTGIGTLLAPLTGGLSIPAGMWLGGLLGGIGGGVGAGMASDALYDKAFGKGEKATKAAETATAAMEQKSTTVSTPVGQHAVPMMKPDDGGVSNVQPVTPGDVEHRVRKDRVEGESKSGKLTSDELVRMEKLSEAQYAETQRMREVMELVASYLKPTGNKIGSESDQESRMNSTRKHVRSNTYGKIKDGLPGSTANRSVYKPT